MKSVESIEKEGGFVIPKSIITATTLIILLLGSLISVVLVYANISKDVESLKEANRQEQQEITTLRQSLNEISKSTTEIKVDLTNIKKQTDEIKTDLRDIKVTIK